MAVVHPLRDARFRRLFAAQVIALVGTGLSTVALTLLAFDLAGGNAAAVLGTALACKMVAYVVFAPIVGGLSGDNMSFTSDKETLIEAADKITLKCGASQMTMKSNGNIVLSGVNLTLKGSGNIVLKGNKIGSN